MLVAVTLRDDASLRGLCFERFTLSSRTEVILNVCDPSLGRGAQSHNAGGWEHLGLTPGVAYVERNLVARRSAEARS